MNQKGAEWRCSSKAVHVKALCERQIYMPLRVPFHCLILVCRASYHLSVFTKPMYSIYSVLTSYQQQYFANFFSLLRTPGLNRCSVTHRRCNKSDNNEGDTFQFLGCQVFHSLLSSYTSNDSVGCWKFQLSNHNILGMQHYILRSAPFILQIDKITLKIHLVCFGLRS